MTRVSYDDALALAAKGELLGKQEMMALFHIGSSRYHQLNRVGAFDHFKMRPALGLRCFLGVRVYRALQGEGASVPTFGRKRA
jgi:hypothetical protein